MGESGAADRLNFGRLVRMDVYSRGNKVRVGKGAEQGWTGWSGEFKYSVVYREVRFQTTPAGFFEAI